MQPVLALRERLWPQTTRLSIKPNATAAPARLSTAMGPAFKGSAFIASGSDEEITEVILKGRTGPDKKYKVFVLGMPAQGLGDDDVSALVKHLKSLAAK